MLARHADRRPHLCHRTGMLVPFGVSLGRARRTDTVMRPTRSTAAPAPALVGELAQSCGADSYLGPDREPLVRLFTSKVNPISRRWDPSHARRPSAGLAFRVCKVETSIVVPRFQLSVALGPPDCSRRAACDTRRRAQRRANSPSTACWRWNGTAGMRCVAMNSRTSTWCRSGLTVAH